LEELGFFGHSTAKAKYMQIKVSTGKDMFTVFTSHSTGDQEIVRHFASSLQLAGVNVYVSEWSPEPGRGLAEKIQSQIDASDCVLILLTKEGGRSLSVGQEIGYAKGKKPIIPIVEKGTDVGVLLQGLEYIPFDRTNPAGAVSAAVNFIAKLKGQKELEQIILAGALLVFFLWLISRK
jgi:hypothetical protein